MSESGALTKRGLSNLFSSVAEQSKRALIPSCCGKSTCRGCIHAGAIDNRELCPFCRTPVPTSDGEIVDRIKKCVETGDAVAIRNLGCFYDGGMMGLPQDYEKAMELYLRAGKLGSATAYHNIAVAYIEGLDVERDEKKAKHYCELAAIRGDVGGRYNLGLLERDAGNMNRAMKHYMIAARAGHDNSLKCIQVGYMNGLATKDDFEKALRAHKDAKDEMKSDQRDAAAAARARGQR